MSNIQNNNTNNVIDISINGISRKRYRINGDDNKILELNPTDFNFTVRMNEAYPKLLECEKKVTELSNSINPDDEMDTLNNFAQTLDKINKEMCEQVDYVFDSNVSEICCDGGSMYDFIDGFMRYEIIFDSLMKLYDSNLTAEAKNIQKRVQQHTTKYTKKRKK